MKNCRQCGPRPIEDFGIRTDAKDGLNYVCKICNRINFLKYKGMSEDALTIKKLKHEHMTMDEKREYWGKYLNQAQIDEGLRL